jgi:hypothetical protein
MNDTNYADELYQKHLKELAQALAILKKTNEK